MLALPGSGSRREANRKRNEESVLAGLGVEAERGSWESQERLFWCQLGPPVHTFKDLYCTLKHQCQLVFFLVKVCLLTSLHVCNLVCLGAHACLYECTFVFLYFPNSTILQTGFFFFFLKTVSSAELLAMPILLPPACPPPPPSLPPLLLIYLAARYSQKKPFQNVWHHLWKMISKFDLTTSSWSVVSNQLDCVCAGW